METQLERTPFYNSVGGGDRYKYNGHLPTVLVVGIRDSENQFTRAVHSYGLEAIHVDPDATNVTMSADAAIVVTSFVSHEKFWSIKDGYKKQGKKVFFARDGFSEIKSEFEMFFFGNLKKSLTPMNWVQRYAYFLGHLLRKPDTRFKYSDILNKMRRYYPEATPIQLNNALRAFENEGMVEHYQNRRGYYIFKGLTEKQFQKLVQAGADPSLEWKKPLVVIPEPVLKLPEPVVEPVAVPELKVETPNLSIDLVLMSVSEMEKKVELLDRKLDLVLTKLAVLDKDRTEQLRQRLLSNINQVFDV